MSLFSGFEKTVRRDEPLAMHTWFQLGGPAEYFAEPENVDELIALVRRSAENNLSVRMLGRGSNLLVADKGVSGLVISLSSSEFRKIAVSGSTLTAGGGTRLGRVVTTSAHRGLAGLEGLVAIPGTVGGALHGNAGTQTTDIGQWTSHATVITATGDTFRRDRDDMSFGYRHSSLDELVILEASFRLEADDPEELSKRLQKQWILHKAGQPMGHQCAGCVFKNPRGMRAGELIEQAGLKGTRIGGAVVSDRHANFIIAEPECTSADVLRLIELVRVQVADRLGVDLEVELDIW